MKKIIGKTWFKIIIIQTAILFILGLWVIKGQDTEIYSFNDISQIENIALEKGTYRAYITYESEHMNNAVTFISKSDDQAFLADTLQMYSWKNCDYIELWAYHDVNDICLAYNDDSGFLNIQHISIAKTKGAKRMCWCMSLFILLIGDIVYGWIVCLKGKDQKEKRNQICISVLLIFVATIASYPIKGNRIIAGHDLIFHLSRIEGLKETILSGQFPVRIQNTWLEGAGYAVSVMYGDWLLYIPAFWRIMGFPLQTCLKGYIILINLGTAVLSYFAFRKISDKRYGCVLGTVLYTLALYRLAGIYIRSSLGEYTAMMFYPMVLCGIIDIFDTDSNSEVPKNKWIMPMIGMVGIITSHAISLLLVALSLVFYVLLHIRQLWTKYCKEILLNGTKIVLGTGLLSAGFIVPFFDYYFTQPMQITAVDRNQYDFIQENGAKINELIKISYGAFDHKVWGIGYFLVFLAFFVIGLPILKKNIEARKQCLCFGVFFFMSTTIFPWDLLSERIYGVSKLTNIIQFPFRFLTIAMVWMCIFIVHICNEMLIQQSREDISMKERCQYGVVSIACIFALCLCIGYEIEMTKGNTYEVYDAAGLGLYAGYGVVSTCNYGEGEYLPIGTVPEKFFTRQISEEDGWLKYPVLYYKGYVATDESGKSLEVIPGDGNSTMVKKNSETGYENIAVRFEEPWYWRISEIVSIAVFFYIVMVIIRKKT